MNDALHITVLLIFFLKGEGKDTVFLFPVFGVQHYFIVVQLIIMCEQSGDEVLMLFFFYQLYEVCAGDLIFIISQQAFGCIVHINEPEGEVGNKDNIF